MRARRVHLGFENAELEAPPGSTTVEMTLEPDGDGTLVRLVHRELRASERADTEAGWTKLLDRLAVVAPGGDPDVPRTD
jgi:uncharacterized protein YndB with AHSA1/START domain